MRRNMRNWFHSITHSEERLAMPILVSPGLAITGREVSEAATSAEVQAECIISLAKKYPSIAAMTMMDLSVEAEAFGCPISFAHDEVPSVSARLVDGEESIESLAVPKVGAGRTGVYLKTAETVARQVSDRPLFGDHIGPFTLAGRLYDLTEILIGHLTHPDAIHDLVEKCTEFLIQYSKAFKEAGADGVIIAEPAAALLSPASCREFSLKYVKQIIDEVQDDEFAVILHNCGDTKAHVKCMVATGASGVSFGNAVDMSHILPQVPPETVAFGNIDPVGKFKMGSPEVVGRCTRMLLDQTTQHRNFVISSGCDVPPGTPLENVDAFFAAVDEYNKTRGEAVFAK